MTAQHVQRQDRSAQGNGSGPGEIGNELSREAACGCICKDVHGEIVFTQESNKIEIYLRLSFLGTTWSIGRGDMDANRKTSGIIYITAGAIAIGAKCFCSAAFAKETLDSQNNRNQCSYFTLNTDKGQQAIIGLPNSLNPYMEDNRIYAEISSDLDTGREKLDQLLNHNYIIEIASDDLTAQAVGSLYRWTWWIEDSIASLEQAAIQTRTVYGATNTILDRRCAPTKNRSCPTQAYAYNYYSFGHEYRYDKAVEVTQFISKGLEWSGPINERNVGSFQVSYIVATILGSDSIISISRHKDESLRYDTFTPTPLAYRLDLLQKTNDFLAMCES